MSDNICPRSNFLHSALQQNHPTWTVCNHCSDEEDEPNPIEAPLKRVRPTQALLIPNRQPSISQHPLDIALDIANTSRQESARATRPQSKSLAFQLQLSLFSAAFKYVDNGGLTVQKYLQNQPVHIKTITHCFITEPTKIYQTHSDMVKAIVKIAVNDPKVYDRDWKLISNCNRSNPGSISHYQSNIYQTTSFIDFLHTAHIAIKPPYRVPLLFIFEFEQEEFDTEPILPESSQNKKKSASSSQSTKIKSEPKESKVASSNIKLEGKGKKESKALLTKIKLEQKESKGKAIKRKRESLTQLPTKPNGKVIKGNESTIVVKNGEEEDLDTLSDLLADLDNSSKIQEDQEMLFENEGERIVSPSAFLDLSNERGGTAGSISIEVERQNTAEIE